MLVNDMSNGQKVCYSGHGLNNGSVKVRSLNGPVILKAIILIPTVLIARLSVG